MSEDPILAAIEALSAKLDQTELRLLGRINATGERMQNQLTAIRDDIATNYGTSDGCGGRTTTRARN